MSKIIYIAGLGHSGSTLLDMSLGTLPGVVGLGELKTVLDDRTRDNHYRSYCTCGKKATECEVWSKVPGHITNVTGLVNRIEAVHGLLETLYGGPQVLVDASKNSYAYIGTLRQTHDLRVIYLTRDVRSWSYARHLSTGKPVLYFMLRWILENMKLRRRFRKMRIAPLWVGYEELSLYPDHLLQKIAVFCDLDYHPDMLTPGRSHSHIISGNVARTDPEKKSAWRYDARWMLSSRILFLSPMVLCLQRLHRKYVYSNVRPGAMKHFFLFGTARKQELSKKYN